MIKTSSRRTFLVGTLIGAIFAISSMAMASWMSDDEPNQYLRIIDDNYDYILGPNHKPEDGPLSTKIIRNCKIEAFVTDTSQLDYAGSSFVKIDGMPKANLNCLIGEARINSMSIAITDGIDTTPTDCIGGWPTRFQKQEAGNFELCRGKNPNPIFVPTPPPVR
ncbi:hypothetical protein KNJ79_12740 [Sphingopyxis indica]|uniref:hypothetical protein n=1 Tax=Sphingopyxis indica TaxID=436663 RepID=UPI002938F073|nr:hypothetical protein [Sphingopyxis indica]WOF42082.1 hypothetical protein KNJ79_12740 [Sphingopyxis indica]